MIIAACREHGLPPPKWEDRPSGVTLTFFARPGSQAEAIAHNPRQHALLEQMKPGDQIRPAEYLARFGSGVSERQARRDLVALEQAGMLLRVGKGTNSAYQRVDRT